MYNISFFKILLVLVTFTLFVSCDKEYSEIGDSLIGENNFDLSKENFSVIAYNQKITPIQSDNLPINALGIYDNPAFGKTTANFATQVTLASVNPTFGTNLSIESVYLDIPYFVDATQTKSISSTTTGVSAGNTYVLDDIYGEPNAKIKLSIYEIDRFMGRQVGVAQTFYSNEDAIFDSFKKGNRLNDDLLDKSQNDEFFFNSAQNSVKTGDIITYSPPSMRLKLNTVFFRDKILNAPSDKLENNAVFMNYFKGLYFKVEQSGSDKGSLALINFAAGKITIKYKEDSTTTPVAPVEKSLVINMTGDVSISVNKASLLEQTNPTAAYNTATTKPNMDLEAERLYLKGGEGSLAILELFGPDANGDGVADELERIRNNGLLINEANLVFHIDADAMANCYEPERIYLYDFTNDLPVLDYLVDGSGDINPKRAKGVFDGNIKKAADNGAVKGRGLTYKIRITNHLRNLVNNKDAKNVKLGLVVTEDIAIPNFNFLRTAIVNPAFSVVPRASVMNPLGTILYGSKSSSNATDEEKSKRLKLEIYYTKPN